MPSLTVDWWLAFPPWYERSAAVARYVARFGSAPDLIIAAANTLWLGPIPPTIPLPAIP